MLRRSSHTDKFYRDTIIDLMEQLHKSKQETELYRDLYKNADEREGVYIDRMEAAMAIIDGLEITQPELYTQLSHTLYPPYMDEYDYKLIGEKCGDEREQL